MSTPVEDRPWRRWSISLALVLGLHGAALAGWAWWHAARPQVPLPLQADAVRVDMAPLPSAPPAPPTDLPPGPPQQEQRKARTKPGPQPEVPKPLPPPRLAEVALPQPERSAAAAEESATDAADVARTAAPPSVQAPPGRRYAAARTVAGESANALVTWQSQVLGWLEQFKRYPRVARRRQQEGVVQVRYHVDRQGRVSGVEVVRGSGHPALDGEAVAAVRRASPLPPPPPEIPGDPVVVTTPVDFSLRDR